MKLDPRRIRKAKSTPCEDFWHTLRLGLIVAAVLFVLLPRVIG